MNRKFVRLINEIRCMKISFERIPLMGYFGIRLQQQNQTIKDLKEVIRCVEVNQREFVDTIDVNSIRMISFEMEIFI